MSRKPPLLDLLESYLAVAHASGNEASRIVGTMGFAAGAASVLEILAPKLSQPTFAEMVASIVIIDEAIEETRRRLLAERN